MVQNAPIDKFWGPLFDHFVDVLISAKSPSFRRSGLEVFCPAHNPKPQVRFHLGVGYNLCACVETNPSFFHQKLLLEIVNRVFQKMCILLSKIIDF